MSPIATSWELRSRRIEFGRLPVVMGIINVTPDSFSDGGKHFAARQGVDAALRMEDAGAAIIDIGGESTRPYSDPVAADEELRRILPVLEGCRHRVTIPISIDTSKARVAAEAVAAGAEIINDVTGLEGDPAMFDLALRTGAGVCVMHMRGSPQTMQDDPQYSDVVEEIHRYLRARRDACLTGGIPAPKICLDPGIGFGKTHEHNLQLLRGARRFLDLGCPILIGHSRKGFIGNVIGDRDADRTAGNLGVSLAMAAAGMHILRVHDVTETVQALQLYEAAGGPLGPRSGP